MIAVSRPRLVVAVVLVVILAVVFAEAAAAQSLGQIRSQLERVRGDLERLEGRMEDTQQRLEDLYAHQARLEDERDALRREIAAQAVEIAALEARVSQRLRDAFMHGAALDPIAVFLASDDAVGALARAETVRRLVDADRASSDALVAARIRAATAEEQLAARTAELEAASRDVEDLLASLQQDLGEAQRIEASLTSQERAELARIERERREAARRAAAAAETEAQAVASSGSMVCPIDRPRSFIDSWGHPRGGGRRHRGTDMMAPHGVAVRAVTDGVWEHRRTGRSAGIWGVLRGADGHAYWYMHLSAHTAGNGARVSAGQQVGRNGATGNATTPHLHFEYHRGGGSPINPYPLLRSIC